MAGLMSGHYLGAHMTRIYVVTAMVLGLWASLAQAAIPDDPALVHPLPVGSHAPAFDARTADGTVRHFPSDGYSKPTILIFYRGGWCPYCNRHLGALKKVEPDLLKMGYELFFLSADRPELLYTSLKEPDVHYTLLSDAKLQAAEAFGIAFHVDAAHYQQYSDFGVDLEAASGETHHNLPVPAVFIIDTRGIIRFVHANPDYTTRISPDELLAAARAVATAP
jgi:peroxiredoxin